MFAEDVANCAETMNSLKQQLYITEQFCTLTGMEVHLAKTQTIVFCEGVPFKHTERWTFRGEHNIQVTSVYKYLGVLFTPWTVAQEKLAFQAQKSIFALYHYQQPYGDFNIKRLQQTSDVMISHVI